MQLSLGQEHSHRRGVTSVELLDSLTGLPGRRAAFAMLARAILLAKHGGMDVLVTLVDLDRFYMINEAKGTAFGDETLRRMADRLRGMSQWSYNVFRLSSNTFLMFRMIRSEEAGQNADASIEEMKGAVEQPLKVRGEFLHPFCSIGASCFPEDGSTAELIVRHADTALQQAKAAGGNRIVRYTIIGAAQVNRVAELRGALRSALARSELSLRYQPLYQVTGELRGFEALLRWRHTKLGDVPPSEFIPLAEQSGLIVEIGYWVIGEVCRMLNRAKSKGLHQLIMSVNLSPLQIQLPNFTDKLRGILAQTGTKPESLELEITESMMIDGDGNGHIEAALNQLREMGVRLALDDFGVGYASLTYLCKLPLHTLKLDRSFIRHIGEERAEHAIVKTMISLVHELGIEVVAEGVETSEQFQLLREWKCDFFQGYLLASPLPEEELHVQLLQAKHGCFQIAEHERPAVLQH
ncbi:bifunctional diguanylate cyclase/phosphodiesterase [Paenibacillus sp. R14(2021)]|uniref:putative bifunctional diguanylate cyclase/phosphodiesterase n=1 Tax=Paenibacillus sp. R14(2021) TaxID=2859228 RepID=UPI001C6159A6|nr:bifunctional diguanylate cyclase/phosphodiesterase [Paenibacillus sp. R14(2021)]